MPIKKWRNFPTINPHVYTEIEDKKIDVSLDPGHEEIYYKNSEKKLIMPVNISQLRRILTKAVYQYQASATKFKFWLNN